MKNIITAAAFTVLAVAAADPALAAWGGGGDVPFKKGLSDFSNWVFVLGVLVALIGLVAAGISALLQNAKGAIAGVVGVIIGATLIAKAPQILSSLTGLNSTL